MRTEQRALSLVLRPIAQESPETTGQLFKNQKRDQTSLIHHHHHLITVEVIDLTSISCRY